MVKAIVFDFDGVIIDSKEIKREAFVGLFKDVCPEKLTEIANYHLENLGVSRYEKFRHIYRDMLKKRLSPEEELQLGQRFSELVLSQILGAPLVPGAFEFLEENQWRRRFTLFVASATPEEELILIARRRGLFEFFKEWHGSPKTKPEIIRDILMRNCFFPSEMVFIGDAISDLKVAEEARVTFIACTFKTDPSICNARYLSAIHDLWELPSLLEQLNQHPERREVIP